MAKQPVGPYDQYDDLQLLLRYIKLCDDYLQHFYIPQWAGIDIDLDKSQGLAIKQDKIVAECNKRGLMTLAESLTEKGKALRPWADPSLNGKYHEFIVYAKLEEIASSNANINEKYEELRKQAAAIDNAAIEKLQDEKNKAS